MNMLGPTQRPHEFDDGKEEIGIEIQFQAPILIMMPIEDKQYVLQAGWAG